MMSSLRTRFGRPELYTSYAQDMALLNTTPKKVFLAGVLVVALAMTFSVDEQRISEWLQENALVCWLATPEPWVVEEEIIRTVPLPLNLDQNSAHPFYATLRRLRAEAKQDARDLPILAR